MRELVKVDWRVDRDLWAFPRVATGRGGAVDSSGDPREVDKVEVVARHEFDVHRVPVACGVDCPSDVACRARAVDDSAIRQIRLHDGRDQRSCRESRHDCEWSGPLAERHDVACEWAYGRGVNRRAVGEKTRVGSRGF